MKQFVRAFDAKVGELVGKVPSGWYGGLALLSVAVSPRSWAVVSFIGCILALLLGDTALVVLSVAALATLPLAEGIKLLIRRQRPLSLYVETMQLRSYSFPSGHAYTAGLGAGYVIAYLAQYISGWGLWAVGAVILALALMVGVSRVYLKAHFPSDVVAGLLLGGIVVSVLVWIVL